MSVLGIAGLVTGVTSSLLGASGRREQARQQREYQRRAAAAERQRLLMEQRSLRIRQAQEQEATAREIGEIARRAREARATATVSAGEAGVAGLSIDALLNQYVADEAALRMGAIRQQEMRDVQARLAFTDAGLRSQNRLIDINRPIPKENPLTTALNAVTSGLSGYRTGLELSRIT